MNPDNNKQPPVPPKGDEQVVQVPQSLLTKMQEQMAELERRDANRDAEIAGLKEMAAAGATTEGEKGLREKKNFEPKFRTVRIRKYPMAGDFSNLGYVIGWDNRGAYQEVDRSGVSPQVVDFINIFFLGHDRTPEGKLKAEKVRLLDLMNSGVQVHCKIIDMKRTDIKIPTGEEIDVSVFDPQHGLVSTGEKVDGYYAQSQIKYTIQIPGVEKVTEIDGSFVN